MIWKNFSLTTKKKIKNNFTEYFSLLVALLVSLSFFVILGFIIYRSVLGFKHYGFKNILISDRLNLSSSGTNEPVSFWLPFVSTILTTSISLLIAVPIGIKSAIFIKFRIPREYQKTFRVVCEILAGIPSVIFGLFASKTLGPLFQKLNINSYSIINASFMLAFMIIPTIIAMTSNVLNNVDYNLLINPIALGTEKSKAIYKIYLKAARNGIIVGIILAMGRALGETTALSMILQNQTDYSNSFSGGLWSTLNSDLKTVSVIISTNMFNENSNEITKSLLFVFGLILFIFIMIFNMIIILISSEKYSQSAKLNKFMNFIINSLWFIPLKLNHYFKYMLFKDYRLINWNNKEQYLSYSKQKIQSHTKIGFYSYYKLFWEIISFWVCITMLIWVILEILVKGGSAANSQYSTIFEFSKNTSGQSFINTALIIFTTILISLPLALINAIYLNEFARNKSIKKIINFFLDSLGSTPSILFGMFGVIFFIETLGWTNNGRKGYSLIAGALTMVLIIIPMFTRTIQQTLENIPKEIRLNAYALGSSKWETINKIILPSALTGIVTSTILSIGRILGETTPLFLTAGLTSSNEIALDRPGQTLTTRIYAQLFNPNITEGENIMYEIAFITLFLILFLIIIGYVIIPQKKMINKFIKEKFLFIKVYFKRNLILSGSNNGSK